MLIVPFLTVLIMVYGTSATCSGSIQRGLRYNSSNQQPLYPSPGLTLAQEICCEDVGLPLAEPEHFYEHPGTLFQDLDKYTDKNGQVTFYDSVCGLPVFRVPVGRTLGDFKKETDKYGWPSFHDGEELKENIVVHSSGKVYSKCGTLLGTTDTSEGLRYCVDLVCISGSPIRLSTQDVKLVTFNKTDTKTFFKWGLTNDPVMGGLSKSTFTIDETNAIGIFNGTVEIVPSLKAPGFCNTYTSNWFKSFNSVADATHITITARTTSPSYSGFKLSICADTILPCQFYSYKANFNITSSSFTTISIPLGDFSNDWSSYTGDCFTVDPNGRQHYCCSKNNQGLKPTKSEVCLTPKNLAAGVKQVGIWSEGHAGDFHIEVLEIGASVLTR